MVITEYLVRKWRVHKLILSVVQVVYLLVQRNVHLDVGCHSRRRPAFLRCFLFLSRRSALLRRYRSTCKIVFRCIHLWAQEHFRWGEVLLDEDVVAILDLRLIHFWPMGR